MICVAQAFKQLDDKFFDGGFGELVIPAYCVIS